MVTARGGKLADIRGRALGQRQSPAVDGSAPDVARQDSEVLKRNALRYFQLIEHAPVAYVMLDGRSGIGAANLAAYRMLDQTRQGLARSRFDDLVAPASLDAWHALLRRSLDGEKAPSADLALVKPGGEHVHARVEAILISLHGAPDEVWLAMTHLSRLWKQAREAGVERQRLEGLIEASSAGVLLVGRKAETILSNQAGKRLLGIRGAGGRLTAAIQAAWRTPDGEPFSPESAPISRGLRGETVRAEEVWIRRRGRQASPVLLTVVPIHDTVGQVREALVIAHDADSKGGIERSPVEFFATISHELRTPLAAIKGYAEMGRLRQGGSSDIADLFGEVNTQADYLLQVIENMVDISHIQAGAFTLPAHPFDLRDLAQAVVDSLQRDQSLTQPVSLQAPREGLIVLGDPKRIERVLRSLLDNARKFSPAASPIQMILTSDGREAKICVADRGVGFGPGSRGRLFRTFSSAHGVDIPGTGLSLTICKAIIEAHGGRISAQSPGDGQGAAFSFTIPLSSPGAARPTAEPPAAGEGQPRPDADRILVVDDSSATVDVLVRALKADGFRAEGTTDPADAVRRVQASPPALVILDIVMPVMDGFQVFDAIRKSSEVPVIFVSGSRDPADAAQALRKGGVNYLSKPLNPHVVAALAEAAIRRCRQPSA